jgi:hypothetical protein
MEEVPVQLTPLGDGITSMMVEVVLDDERRVRLNVDSDGQVWVRTWGTTPIRLGNGTQSDFKFPIAKQEPNHDEHGCRLKPKDGS